MNEFYSLKQIDSIVEFIRSKSDDHPKVGIILGSGLGSLAASIEYSKFIPYNEIPDWPVSTVIGHQGRLVIGKFENKEVIVLQGRAHYYEGTALPKSPCRYEYCND